MVDTFGNTMADMARTMIAQVQTAATARRESAVRALVRRKLQEMRREVARLGGAIQQAERQLETGADDPATEFAWAQASHQLRGWVASLVESQAYIDSIGNAQNHFDVKIRQVMAVAKSRAQAEQLIVSRS